MAHQENPDKLSQEEDLDGKTEINNSFEGNAAHAENIDADQLRANINAKIANPLAGYSHAERMSTTSILLPKHC